MDEIRGLLCHTANLKEEVVKGIIQRSEFKPKLAQQAQCVAPVCFKSQPVVLNHNSVEGTRKVRGGPSLHRTLCKHGQTGVGDVGAVDIKPPSRTNKRKNSLLKKISLSGVAVAQGGGLVKFAND